MNWSWHYRPERMAHRLIIDFGAEEARISKLDSRHVLFFPDALPRPEEVPRMLRALADKMESELARRGQP